MGILDSILGGGSGNQAGGGSGGFNTKTMLLMGLLAMIASRSSGAQGQGGEGGLLGSLGGALGGMLGGGAGAGGAGGLGGLLGGLLGGAQSQSAGAGTPTTSPGDLIGALGGLGGLTQMLNQGGLGDAVKSWVGTGDNQSVTPDQVSQALGPGGQLQQLASTAGVSEGEAAQELSSLLPQVINHLTPNGSLPQGPLDLATLAQQFLGGQKT